jgi:NADP-dependent 3-hydroxy acid dehydrogenase YdfG
MDLSLRGRVALITGPAKGMGAAVSMAFAVEGCLMALAGRDTAAIAPVAQDIRTRGGEALVVAVTSPMRCNAKPRSRRRSPPMDALTS